MADGRTAGFQGHHRLGSKVSLILGSQGIGALLGYTVLLAVGRYYSPGAYGAYLFAVSLVGIFSSLFQLGFNQAHQRELARGLPVEAALGVYVRIRAALSAGLVVAILLAAWTWLDLLGRTHTDATSLTVVFIILASTVVAGGRRVATDTWVAQGRIHRAEWCNTLDSIVYAGVVAVIGLGFGAASGRWVPFSPLAEAVAGALNLPADPSTFDLAIFVAVGHFAGKVAAILLAAFWWLSDKTVVGPWDPELARQYRAFAFPVALTGMLALALQHTDVLMLGYFWTTKQVGWYGAAQKLAGIALLANIALRGLLMPYFASLIKAGKTDQAMRAFLQVERFLLLVVVPVAIAMMIWAEAGIHILVGDGFLGGAPALRWLAAWTLVAALSMPVRTKHLASGDTQILVRSSMLNLTINVVLNVILIPQSILGVELAGLGAEGAAMATFASSLVSYAYTRAHATRTLSIRFVDLSQVRVFAAGLVPLVIWLVLRARLPATAYDRVWGLAFVGAIGAAAYVLTLIVTRTVRMADWDLIRSSLNPRELGKEARGRG